MSRCQSASRPSSRCPSRRSSQVKFNNNVRPQSARPNCPPATFNCRPGCTVCCLPAQVNRPPTGILVERTVSCKPKLLFVPSCAKMDGLSTYREFYHPKCGERVKPYKPDTSNFDPSCAKMDGMTTYREFYYPKCGLRSISCKVQTQFLDPSCAKMDGLTTYKNDYVGVHAARVKSLKPLQQFDPSCAKMDGMTTYRNNYIPYCPQEYSRLTPIKPSQGDFACAPFEGMTTYRQDFWPKPIIKVPNLKPILRDAFSNAPLDDITTYRNAYPGFYFDKNCGLSQCLSGQSQEPPQEYICENPCPPMPSQGCGGGEIYLPPTTGCPVIDVTESQMEGEP